MAQQGFGRTDMMKPDKGTARRGIQYWFCYPFHDDPKADNHRHDWWYFWVWYDTSTHAPGGVVYDFHHNLRAYSFSSPRVHRDGLHVKTWHDAGGHRAMFAPGGDIDLFLAKAGQQHGLYNALDTTQTLWVNLVVLSYPVQGAGSECNVDNTIGAMAKHLGKSHVQIYSRPLKKVVYTESSGEGTIAPWREGSHPTGVIDVATFRITMDTSQADYGSGPEFTHVEAFPHWVWVWGVEADPFNIQDEVYFTGDNILPPSKGAYDEWPVTDANGISTYLPWRSGLHKDDKSGKFISTTEMVWKWKQYDPDGYDANNKPYYLWGLPQSPTIFTRYYDGSP